MECYFYNNNIGINGILFDSSYIYWNNFITSPAHDNGHTNVWFHPVKHQGNYWDDYIGVDADGNGIGDTPHPIPGGSNEDTYPLMNIYGYTYLSLNIQPRILELPLIITNIGEYTALNIKWQITIDGGILLFGNTSSGDIPTCLQTGEDIQISTGLILLGFGALRIKIDIWADNTPMESEQIDGFLLILILII
jgi:hypothetical protein